MQTSTRCSLAAICFLLSSSAFASPQWYRGVITRIAITVNNDFILTLDSGVLSDCQYSYVYFLESILGTSGVKNAYAMALTAKATGMQFGTVIDKAINGPGGQCNQGNNMFDAT